MDKPTEPPGSPVDQPPDAEAAARDLARRRVLMEQLKEALTEFRAYKLQHPSPGPGDAPAP